MNVVNKKIKSFTDLIVWREGHKLVVDIYIRSAENLSIHTEDGSRGIHTSSAELIKLRKTPAFQAGEVYKATSKFPKEETYSLTDQMRRSATSVTSNIAEGFGRQTYKEKIQFYYLVQGSLTELKNQLIIAKHVGFLRNEIFDQLAMQANIVHQLLQGLIKKSKLILNSSILNHKS